LPRGRRYDVSSQRPPETHAGWCPFSWLKTPLSPRIEKNMAKPYGTRYPPQYPYRPGRVFSHEKWPLRDVLSPSRKATLFVVNTFGCARLGAQLVSLCLRIDKLETQVGKALDERLNKENHQVRGSRFESMPDCMQPNIDSGATPIGSVGRAPDRKITSKIVDIIYATHDLRHGPRLVFS
jgi:hypothetical protein